LFSPICQVRVAVFVFPMTSGHSSSQEHSTPTGRVGATRYFSDVGFSSFGEFFFTFFPRRFGHMAHLPAKSSPTHYCTTRGEIGVLKGGMASGNRFNAKQAWRWRMARHIFSARE
jgi:hypothetical protein